MASGQGPACPKTISAPSAVDWRSLYDQLDPPHSFHPVPLTFVHPTALAAVVADFDQDGTDDVALGGNSDPAVQIFYLRPPAPGSSDWSIDRVEALPQGVTSACYDLAVGFLDQDGYPDLAVGRLADEVDQVLLNDGDGGVSGHYFDTATTVALTPLPQPPGQSTFGVAIGEVNGAGGLDVVTVGANYHTRFFAGDGLGGFSFVKDYPDPNGGIGMTRDVVLGDVNGDPWTDMVVSRVADYHEAVWFGTGNPADPFAYAPNQPVLQREPTQLVAWRVGQGCAPAGSGTCGDTSSNAFEIALGDLDGDGDNDLVCTNPLARNVAYFNNGTGYFGSCNAASGNCTPCDPGTPASPYNDGKPAFVFPEVNSPWPSPGRYARSQCLFHHCFEHDAAFRTFVIANGLDWTCIEFNIPAALLNFSTGVALYDVDRDGKLDVGFSNRNDIQEWCLYYHVACQPCTGNIHSGTSPGNCFPECPGYPNCPPCADPGPFLYLNATHPDPQIYDLVFYNNVPVTGHLSFQSCVELINSPNDGTGYAEFYNLNGGDAGYRPEWIDANFSNLADQYVNHLFFGEDFGFSTCILNMLGGGMGPSLGIDAGPLGGGAAFVLVASAWGPGKGLDFSGIPLPLQPDALGALFVDPKQPYPGSAGVLDASGHGEASVGLPDDPSLVGKTVWFVAVLSGGPQKVTNVVQVPVSP